MKVIHIISGDNISDSHIKGMPQESTVMEKCFYCPVCGEDMGQKKYACKSINNAIALDCINIGGGYG